MKGGATSIRRVRVSEWRAFRELRLRALRSDPLAFGSTFDRERRYPSERWQRWARQGARPGTAPTWVVQGADGGLVGMVGLFRDRRGLHIWGMWVDPSLRGRGLGGRLLATLLRWFRAHGNGARLRLDVNRAQSEATHLYETRGFRFTGAAQPLGHDAPACCHEMSYRPVGARGTIRND